MAIKDYWVYQKRACIKPWALYVVKEYDKRAGRKADVLDYTLYHEDIENATHSISRVGIHSETVAGYVHEILSDLVDYAEVTSNDVKHLTASIQDILLH